VRRSGKGAVRVGEQELGRAAEDYLRAAIATATTHVYAGLTVVAALTIAGALLIMPKHFSTTAGESASTGPGEAGPAGTGTSGTGTSEAGHGEPGHGEPGHGGPGGADGGPAEKTE